MKVTSLMKRKPSDDALDDRPSPKDVVAYRAWMKSSSFDAKIEELRARRRATHDRLLEIEAAGGKRGKRDETQTRVEQRAKSLLGETKLSVVDASASLDDLFEELAAIDRAIGILSERKTAEFCAKIAGEMLLRRDEGRDLAYRRAQWALEGRRLHAESEAFKASLAGAAANSASLFPTGAISLAPLFAAGAPLKRLIEEALRSNIITKSEVEK